MRHAAGTINSCLTIWKSTLSQPPGKNKRIIHYADAKSQERCNRSWHLAVGEPHLSTNHHYTTKTNPNLAHQRVSNNKSGQKPAKSTKHNREMLNIVEYSWFHTIVVCMFCRCTPSQPSALASKWKSMFRLRHTHKSQQALDCMATPIRVRFLLKSGHVERICWTRYCFGAPSWGKVTWNCDACMYPIAWRELTLGMLAWNYAWNP